MGGKSARTLEMNTENSIRKEIGRPMFGLENYIKMDLKGILCVRMWSGFDLVRRGFSGWVLCMPGLSESQ